MKNDKNVILYFVKNKFLGVFVAILFKKFNCLLTWFVVMQDDVFSNVLGYKISVLG